MAQRTITLIRHGRCYPDDDDPTLDEVGRHQAEITAGALQDELFGTIYYSPLRRATETAGIIARHHPNSERVMVDDLREGVPLIPPIFARYFQKLDRPNLTEPALAACKRRFDAAYDRIFQPAASDQAHDLVVCHGNIIRYLLCRALNVDPAIWPHLVVDHCSIIRVVVAPEALQSAAETDAVLCSLVMFNQTAHLR